MIRLLLRLLLAAYIDITVFLFFAVDSYLVAAAAERHSQRLAGELVGGDDILTRRNAHRERDIRPAAFVFKIPHAVMHGESILRHALHIASLRYYHIAVVVDAVYRAAVGIAPLVEHCFDAASHLGTLAVAEIGPRIAEVIGLYQYHIRAGHMIFQLRLL